mmetsp:Transcript_15372/g.17399  ORF Transcript_15372/g.17399 Transcript_15372/m.17399 type:complete len:252 (+) Transcript_15372:273-1028(+)|eukprot:CAMPEP_0184051694 /NCGR_PEP_ID=MMETSP0956-20121227/4826_1 /TAXON_ID=627963 /ORGANISM="Aplanochytrium sp, Strain PBS07" /LENGTH=251 /DNA_ID=CAMNT_0026344561 /DNA_START=53 /DNA_END=808 /DNA_ORIENTATION=+
MSTHTSGSFQLPPKPQTIGLKTQEDEDAKLERKDFSRKQSGLIKVKERSKSYTKKKPTMGTGKKRGKKKKNKNPKLNANLPRVVSISASYVSQLDEAEREAGFIHDQRFMGTWVSEEAGDMEAFVDEMNLGAAFKKMAKKFGGGQKQMLTIVHDGDEFEIIDSNERRELEFILTVGEQFSSVDEKGEKIKCYSSWDDEEKKTELIIDCINENTNKAFTIKRRITEDGELVEVREEEGNEVSRRTYQRLGQF